MGSNTFPPYVIVALGPFCPTPEEGYTPRIITVPSPDLRATMAALAPRLWIPLPTDICPAGGVTIAPERMQDFTPEGLLRIIPYLRDLTAAGEHIAQGQSRGVPPAALAAEVDRAWPHLPLDLSLSSVAPAAGHQENAVDDILAMVSISGRTAPGGTGGTAGPGQWRRQVEGLLSESMSGIFADESFRTCEAVWRGLECLIRRRGFQTDGRILLKIVPVSAATLAPALDALTAELADEPPDLILIDVPLNNTPEGVALLEKAAALGASLLVPAAAWITPAFFHLPAWKELCHLDYLKHRLDDPVYAKWRKLRGEPDGQWLTATCNRFLTRPPYGRENSPRRVAFTEEAPLWISPVWALGALAAKSVNRHGWPSRLTDYPEMRLTDLALATPQAVPAGGTELRTATEVLFSEERRRQFTEIGITPLVGAAGRDVAFLPKAVVVSGESLPSRMFFSRLIGRLIRLREAWADSGGEADPAGFVAAGLASLFAATGQETPPDLQVTGGFREAGAPPALEISLTPPATVSPETRRLVFTFAW